MTGTFAPRRVQRSGRTAALGRSRLRRPFAALALTSGLLGFGLPATSLVAQPERPVVVTAEVDGIIHPVTVQYLRRVLARADEKQAALVVIELRTPGGLVDSTRDINNAIISAKTPVAVFVGPSGNRAASAGFLITIAADIAAMAPGTHIGAAHPVSGDGQRVDDTMAKKMVSDVAGYARTLAAQRKRNVELAEQAVTESRSFTHDEARKATPPLIDLVASDTADLLRQLDGRTVVRFDGRTAILRTADAVLEPVGMTRAQRILSALAHPQIAYLLLTLGMLGLTVEFWNPGAIFPGVAGAICLLLAFFAFQVLPVNYAGVALIFLGILLLVLEVKVTSFGLLAAGGLLSLVLGSMILIDSPLPALQVGLRLIIPMTVATAGIILFLVSLAIRAHRAAPVTGAPGMLNEVGQALSSIDPGGVGRVRTHGEIWTATAMEPVSAGDVVRVTDVQGLLLTVRPDRTTARSPAE